MKSRGEEYLGPTRKESTGRVHGFARGMNNIIVIKNRLITLLDTIP